MITENGLPLTSPDGGTHAAQRDLLQQRLSKFEHIAPLSDNALRLMNACTDSDCDVDELVTIIESDPAISVAVLAAANSPLYGYSRRVSSVDHAVVVLGFRTISRLATSFSTASIFTAGTTAAEQRRQLFQHSLGCASIARALTTLNPIVDPGAAFLSGVLHDVGKLVFYETIPDSYIEVTSGIELDLLPQTELRHFGISHEQVGQMCAEKWGLPVEIIQAIGSHHGIGENYLTSTMAQVVDAANHFAIRLGIGSQQCDIDWHHESKNEFVKGLNENSIVKLSQVASAEFEVISSLGEK